MRDDFQCPKMREEVGNWLGYTGSGIIALHYVKPSDFLQLLALFLRLVDVNSSGHRFSLPIFPPPPPPPQVLGNYSRRGSYWAQGKTYLKPAKRCTEGTSTCLVLKINIFKVVLERHVEVLASDCLFFHTQEARCLFKLLDRGWTFSVTICIVETGMTHFNGSLLKAWCELKYEHQKRNRKWTHTHTHTHTHTPKPDNLIFKVWLDF